MELGRVLVADDDAEVRDLLRRWLEPLGAEVTQVADGAEALAMLRSTARFDLLITDVRMPSLSGLRALALARFAGLRTPALVITSLDDEAVRASIGELEPARLLRKPFGAEELRTTIDELVAEAEQGDG